MLDDWLGHAEFVNPVVQRGDVLFNRVFLNTFDGFGLESANQRGIATDVLLRKTQIRLRIQQGGTCLIPVIGFTEADDDTLAVPVDARMADVFIAQQGADIGTGGVETLGQRALQIDLQQEVHATA